MNFMNLRLTFAFVFVVDGVNILSPKLECAFREDKEFVGVMGSKDFNHFFLNCSLTLGRVRKIIKNKGNII